MGQIFEIFQICGHEIKNSTQGNSFKFLSEVAEYIYSGMQQKNRA